MNLSSTVVPCIAKMKRTCPASATRSGGAGLPPPPRNWNDNIKLDGSWISAGAPARDEWQRLDKSFIFLIFIFKRKLKNHFCYAHCAVPLRSGSSLDLSLTPTALFSNLLSPSHSWFSNIFHSLFFNICKFYAFINLCIYTLKRQF